MVKQIRTIEDAEKFSRSKIDTVGIKININEVKDLIIVLLNRISLESTYIHAVKRYLYNK